MVKYVTVLISRNANNRTVWYGNH